MKSILLLGLVSALAVWGEEPQAKPAARPRHAGPWLVFPQSVAVDSAGNLFVTDSVGIYRVTPAGAVTTVADRLGPDARAGGTKRAERFRPPVGVAVDVAGNLFLAYTLSNTILKVTSAGVMTMLAGGESTGYADGTGGAARFDHPRGMALDPAGNLFVADTGNHVIRIVTPAGVVTTFAGSPGRAGSADGTGAAAQFNAPRGVAIGRGGNVFVADTGNNSIRRVTPSGRVLTLAGGPGRGGSADGTGGVAQFDGPRSVAVDSAGNVFVADTLNNTIRKVTPDGVVSTLAGRAARGTLPVDGMGSIARFNHPKGVAVDGAGNVFVADTYSWAIRKVTPEGVVTTVEGSP